MTEAPQVEGERSTQSSVAPHENIKSSRDKLGLAISILREVLEERGKNGETDKT